MHKYLVTSYVTVIPWLCPVLKFFFMNIQKIAARGIHMPSLYGASTSVLNIIGAIKFEYLSPIQLLLKNISLGYPTNSSFQIPLPLT